ncbi:MAG TPA: HDOD domain-containing protein [candidate division Zixibacteria bacterium]|nr:HDOD domain-containing protein [candidate division Zixibacteria bacterium]
MTVDGATVDNKVKSVVQNIRNLPTPPIVFHQIQKVINDPNSSAVQVAAVLAEDPAMSVKVLKLTNSAFYGLAREIESVKQAVQIVGMEAVKNLVLSASVLDMFKSDNIDQEYQESFWRHSLATAFCCRLLARRVKSRGIVDPDSAFSAGLLHDVGKLVISCFLPDEFLAIQTARENNPDTADVQLEELVLGYSHAQVGGVLAAQWKLPHKLREAITCHHVPQLSEDDSPIAYIVHLANYVAKWTFYDHVQQANQIGNVADGVLEYMNLQADDLVAFSEMLKEEYSKAETFMQMVGIG